MFDLHFAPEFLEVSRLQMLECFVFYSVLGWLVESAYMSICTGKLTNRGFGFGPFCPIYGFGATIGAIVLSPFRRSVPLLYVVSAVSATVFELIVGRLMQLTLGDFWWDYCEKPFNYQGIICLESTLGWGLYGIIVVRFLHPFVLMQTFLFPRREGFVLCFSLLFLYMFDFVYHVLLALHVDAAERAHERTIQAMESARERTAGAYENARERTALVVESARERTAGAYENARERTAMVVETAREKTSDAIGRTADVYVNAKDKMSEKQHAVLNWYRRHRWR